ncbi:MAG: LPS assembly protein LptD [Kangiellaceae bacterium]|nr:LPS assembly protein LptD [Kangiellaceae bacterium]
MVSKKTFAVKSFLVSSLLFALYGTPSVANGTDDAVERSQESQAPETQTLEPGFKLYTQDFPEFKTCPSQAITPVRYQAPTQGSNNPKGPIRVVSNDAQREGDKAYLTGNVVVTQDGQQLTANKLTADNSTQSYTAKGDLLFTNQNFVVGADNLYYQAAVGSTQIENTRFHLYSNNGNGTADSITVDNKQLLTLNNSEFSTCPTDQRSWAFESERIVIDRESGWGKAYNSVVRIADIPVFYLPYITFPVDDRRKSGLLPPSFSNSNRNGRDFSIPYYFNLAPNYDLTLTPRYMTSRGAMLGTEFRYLTEASYGEWAFEYLPNDKGFDAASGESEKRWQYDIQHLTSFADNWTTGINARKVSDDGYFQDFGGGIENSNQDVLSQNLFVQYQTRDWFFRTEYQDWQLLNSPVQRYSIAPRIQLTRFFEPTDGGLHANIHTELTRFDKDNALVANRYHVEPTLSWSHETLYSFVRPKVSYAFTQYEQEDPLGNKSSITRGLPTASVDAGLFFERDFSLDSGNYTQTVEPHLFYLYTPFEEQNDIGVFDTSLPTFNFTQLFSRNRFSGLDRIADANQISGALTSRILDEQGREKMSLSLGRIVYLQDRKVQLIDSLAKETAKQSGLLAEINWRWTDSIEVKSSIEWDDQTNDTKHGLLNLHYEPQPNHIINLGHRYRERLGRKQEEAELAFAWPIKDNWRLLGRYNQDLTENRTNDSFIGLEYESCCWAVRLVARRYLNIQLDNEGFIAPGQSDEHSSGVFLQFVLKGIGSLRGSTTEFLEESIYGYEDLLGK